MIHMTTIEFVHDKKYGYSAFRVSGHSGYADEGSDIVCAYISSAVEFALSLLCDAYGVKARLDVSEDTACVECVIEDCAANSAKGHDIAKILTTLRERLSDLGSLYPENVKITERKILQ